MQILLAIARLGCVHGNPVPPASKPSNLELRLEVSEPVIRNGQLEILNFKKRFVLDPQKLVCSRQYNKISTRLEPDLRRIFQGLARADACVYGKNLTFRPQTQIGAPKPN